MVLWGIDNIKTEGSAVAQVLWLLGVKPRRDAMNRATDVEVIPLEKLGRPRIDVVMTVSGIFRDLFGATMTLLDKAVRKVAALDEPSDMNFIKRNVEEQIRETGCSFRRSRGEGVLKRGRELRHERELHGAGQPVGRQPRAWRFVCHAEVFRVWPRLGGQHIRWPRSAQAARARVVASRSHLSKHRHDRGWDNRRRSLLRISGRRFKSG